MDSRKSSKRPPVTRETRAEPPHFEIQEMPDPIGHLTDEQKKWPVLNLNASVNGELSQVAPQAPKIRKGPLQPKAPRFPRTNHDVPLEAQVAQEMADPWGHLSEAMKKKIFGDAGPPAPPTPTEPTPATPKPTESRPEPC